MPFHQLSLTRLLFQTQLLSLVFICCVLGPMLAVDLSAQIATSQSRTWTDPTGKHKTVAELVESDEESVTLKKENGKTIKVPLTRLCEADQEFLKNLTPPNPIPELNVSDATSLLTENPAKEPPIPVATQPAETPKPIDDPVTEESKTAYTVATEDIARSLASQNYPELRKLLKILKTNWPEKPDPNLVPVLVSVSQSQEKFTRLLSLELLATHDIAAHFDAIADRMSDSSFEIRWKSYEYLAEIGSDLALEKLMEKYTGEDSNKICSLLESFGPRAEVAVLRYLTDPAKNTRLSTCNLLAKIGTKRSIAPLKNLHDNDSELSVRYQAKNALERIADRESRTIQDRSPSE